MERHPAGGNPWRAEGAAGDSADRSAGLRNSPLFTSLVVLCAVGVVWMFLLLALMASSLLVSEDALSASLVLLQPTSILVTLSISLLPGVLLGTWLNERGRAASVTLETIIRRKESMQRELDADRADRAARAARLATGRQERQRHDE